MNPCFCRTAALCALVVVSSCSEGSRAEVAVAESGGWRLVEESRIGVADGNGPAAFGEVVALAIDGLDRVWVADGRNHQIRVFDVRGRHVRSIGRKGGGPAEFGSIAGMAWGADGNLWVLDGTNQRFAVYDTAGALVTTHLRRSNYVAVPWPGSVDREGRLIDAVQAGDGREVIVRHAPGAVPADTVVPPPFRAEYFTLEASGPGGRTITQMNVPFTGSQLWRVDPRGNVWISRTDLYRIERRPFGGAPDLVVERPAQPVRVGRRERAEVLEQYEDFQRKGGKVDVSRIPRTYPALNSFFFGDDGRMWVFPVLGPDRPALDLFSPEGSYVARVVPPAPLVPIPSPADRGSRMAALVRDESGVEYVLVMRIGKPAP